MDTSSLSLSFTRGFFLFVQNYLEKCNDEVSKRDSAGRRVNQIVSSPSWKILTKLIGADLHNIV